MKRLFTILGVLLVALFITDNVHVHVPKKPPIHAPANAPPTPKAATQKIDNRIQHVRTWLTSSANADGRRMVIYVALAAALIGAVLRRSGAKAAHIAAAGVLLVFLAEPIFVGFLGFSYYVRTSNWQYTNFLIIGALEAAILALGYVATPQSG
jgi:hypothetical protein